MGRGPGGRALRSDTPRRQAPVHQDRSQRGEGELRGPLRSPRRPNRGRDRASERRQPVRPRRGHWGRATTNRRGDSEELLEGPTPRSENRRPRQPGARQAPRNREPGNAPGGGGKGGGRPRAPAGRRTGGSAGPRGERRTGPSFFRVPEVNT